MEPIPPATAYIVLWCVAGFAGLVALTVTARLLVTFGDRREAPWDVRYFLAFIGYPCVIMYYAVEQVRRAIATPGSFIMLDLLIPGGALLLAAVLGLAEWRYVASDSS